MDSRIKKDISKEILGKSTRFEKGPAPLFVKEYYERIIKNTSPFFYACIDVNLVHIIALWKAKVLDSDIAGKFLDIAKYSKLEDIDPKLGNIYLNLEKILIKKMGDIGGHAYIGRSRVDYEATIRRIFTRDRTLAVMESIIKLREAILKISSLHLDTIMPGYTHSKQGQPWIFAHYLVAFENALQRDYKRLKMGFHNSNLSSLGTGALAGVNIDIDRELEAHLLGFEGIIDNSKDAGSSRDYALEVVSACSILLCNLGQVATEICTWCTDEFGTFELDDSLSGTSSFMPQKKNPLAAEEIRVMAGHSIGWLPSLLGLLKTWSEEIDQIEFCPEMVIDEATDKTSGMTNLMSEIISTIKVNTGLLAERAKHCWATAGELASVISKKEDIPWRIAHGMVGKLVNEASKNNILPGDKLKEMLDSVSLNVIGRETSLSEEEIQAALDPIEFAKSRKTTGSINPREIERMIQKSEEILTEDKKDYENIISNLIKAKKDRDEHIKWIKEKSY